MDYTAVVWLFSRNEKLLLETLMGTLLVIVVIVSVQNLPQMTFTQDQKLIQTFLSYCSHLTLGKCIGIGCPKRCVNDVHAFGLKNGIK